MAQFLRPDSDIELGSWTTSPLFSKINEVASNDSPFIVSPQQTLTAMEVGLSSVLGAGAGTRTLRVRARKTNTQTRGLDWSLKVNGVSVQSGTILANLTTTFTTYSITITEAISDYSDISLELTATGATGGGGTSRSDAQVSWVEFEVPDDSPDRTVFPDLLSSITTIFNPLVNADLSTLNDGLMFSYSMETNATLVDDTDVNNGTNTDTTLVTGRAGNGLQYNGTSSISQAPDSTSLKSPTTAITLMADIYPTAAGQSGVSVVVGKSDGTVGAQSYAIGFTSSRTFRLRVNDAGALRDITSTITAPLNEWSRVIFRIDSNVIRDLRVGNQTETFANLTFSMTHVTDPLVIGSAFDAGATDRRFTGTADNVMAWNRALTNEEIGYLTDAPITYADFNPSGPNTYDESIALSSDASTSEASIIDFDSAVTFESDTVVDNAGGKDIEGLVDLDIDSQIAESETTEINLSVDLSSDTEMNSVSDLSIDSSLNLSGDSSIDQSSILDTEGSVNLTSDSDINITGGADIDESVTLSSDGDFTALSDLLLELNLTISVDGNIDSVGTSDTDNSVNLGSNSTINTAGDVVGADPDLYTFDNTFDSTFAKVQPVANIYDEVINLGADGDLIALSDIVAEPSVTLSTDNTLVEQGELVAEPSLNLTSDSDIAVTGGADVDESITLSADNDLNANSDLSTEGSLTLSTDNQLTSASEAVMDGSVNINSGAGFDEQNIAVIETVRTFLSDNTIQFSDESVVELVVTLTSVSGLTLESIVEYLNEVSLTSNHTDIYESFVDYLGNITLVSEHFNIFSSQVDIEVVREFSTDHNIAFDILSDYFNTLSIEGFTETIFESILELHSLINLASISSINIQTDLDGFQESVVFSCRAWFMRIFTGSIWDSTFDQSFGIEEFNDINLAEVDMFPEVDLPIDSEIDQNSVADFHNDVDLDSDADTGDGSDGVFGNIIDLISNHLIIFDLDADDIFNHDTTLTAEGQILFDILGNYVGSLGLTIDVSDFYDIVSELVGELDLSSGSTIQFDTDSGIEKTLTLSANARIRFVGLLKGRLTIIGSKWIKGSKNIR